MRIRSIAVLLSLTSVTLGDEFAEFQEPASSLGAEASAGSSLDLDRRGGIPQELAEDGPAVMPQVDGKDYRVHIQFCTS